MPSQLLPFSPLQSIIVPIFFILLIIPIPSCYSQVDESYNDCTRSYSCGHLITNITYPFWGNGRLQLCGHPEFELNCPEDNLPTIAIFGNELRVLRINQSSHLMTVVQSDLLDGYCDQGLLRNISLNFNLFRYSQTVRNLSIFYNCSSEITNDFPNSNITCAVDGRENHGFYANESDLRVWRESLPFPPAIPCSEGIQVQVLWAALEELSNESSGLQGVLNQGFEVEYDAENVNCSRCEGSGGVCGSNILRVELGFVCHCRDGTFLRICETSAVRSSTIGIRARFRDQVSFNDGRKQGQD